MNEQISGALNFIWFLHKLDNIKTVMNLLDKLKVLRLHKLLKYK